MEPTKDLTYYKTSFANLHTAKQQGLKAPHKPLLLLSIIDLVEQGTLVSNRIRLTDDLITAFQRNTAHYVGHSPVFTPNIGNPFYHMQHEPFWMLEATSSAQQADQAADSEVPYGKKSSVSYSTKSLREHYSYALIDPELFALLQQENVRVQLRLLLIETYLTPQAPAVSPIEFLPVCLALCALIA